MERPNARDIHDTEAKLQTSIASGLSGLEAKKRLQQYGRNEITAKAPNRLLEFAKKFWGPIPVMLEMVIVITYFLNDYKDLYIILALLVFNGVVSFLEERKADNSLELLKKHLTINAIVLRDGKWSTISAAEIVPGDIIKVRIGSIAPADGIAVAPEELKVDQSILTGEAMPVKKGEGDMVYSGSTVASGESVCIVSTTGYKTYYGRTARLVQNAKPKLHLQELIMSIMKRLIALDLVLVTIMSAFVIYVLKYTLLETLPFALIVIIASVPVALPAAFTVTMAIGAEKLSKKSVLVTNLDAIEEASTVNIICFDKTGTITENKLEIKEVVPYGNFTKEDVIEAAALCSRKEDNDPIDTAVIDYAGEIGLDLSAFKIKKFTPFQPGTKEASAIAQKGKSIFYVAKGAVSIILRECDATKAVERKAIAQTEGFSLQKFRTIAVSRKQRGRSVFLGIIAMYDRPKKDARRMIGELISLGVKVKMLTGDNVSIAKEIAREVGINGKVVDTRELKGKSKESLAKIIMETDVFAEIYPEDKFMIVKALQSAGYKVGMTGDGVNDAPALKQAEVGIAVRNATDVAKSVAAIVLEKNGLEVIIDAIKESRRIFGRMKTYTIVKITRVIQILFYILIMLFALKAIPVLPFGLILLIFTNDIVNISISTDNVGYSERPDIWNVSSLMKSSMFLGIGMVAISLIIAQVGLHTVVDMAEFTTFSFLLINITDNILLYSVRSRTALFGTMPSKKLLAASFAGVSFGILASYFGIFITGISGYAIALLLVSSVMLMAAFSFAKVSIFKRFDI